MKFVEESSGCKLRIVCEVNSPDVMTANKNTRRTREERRKPRNENDQNNINVSSIKKSTN